MSERPKVSRKNANRAAQSSADKLGLNMDAKELEVYATLMAHHAGIEIMEDQ